MRFSPFWLKMRMPEIIVVDWSCCCGRYGCWRGLLVVGKSAGGAFDCDGI